MEAVAPVSIQVAVISVIPNRTGVTTPKSSYFFIADVQVTEPSVASAGV